MQWIGTHLPVQGTRIDPWSGKIPHALEWQVPELLSLWAETTEPMSRNHWNLHLQPVLCSRRSHCNGKPIHCNWRQPSQSSKDPVQPKIIKYISDWNLLWLIHRYLTPSKVGFACYILFPVVDFRSITYNPVIGNLVGGNRYKYMKSQMPSESCSVVSSSLGPHGLHSPWNSPGQNIGVGSFPFSRGSSQPKDRTQVSHITGRFFTSWATREAQEYWSG